MERRDGYLDGWLVDRCVQVGVKGVWIVGSMDGDIFSKCIKVSRRSEGIRTCGILTSCDMSHERHLKIHYAIHFLYLKYLSIV
jgi:hypothetical protein